MRASYPPAALYSVLAGSRTRPYDPMGGAVRTRPLLWFLAFLLLAAAAAFAYSPRLSRHTVPLALFGASLFVLGWAVEGGLLDGGD